MRAAREWSRTAVVALTATLTIAASAAGATAEPQPGVPPTASSPSQPDVGVRERRVRPDGQVDVRTLPKPRRGAGQEAKPFRPAPKLARAVPRVPSGPVTTSGVIPKAAPGTASPKAVPSTAVLERLKTFRTLGNVIVEMINRNGQIYDKAGNAVCSPFDTSTFGSHTFTVNARTSR
ncbi:hypothetical protein MTF65_14120 [Streptomyces sp. APSN-46.1]|uniref:hypothetical protein n=1 Tax=Streptomyces sp. APSN-46.1 TaxID=2929049 RepID=UPI001FB208E5|nr:hypothetical protein [Streptomyces sp. APSN-46.1]MCJ1678464.1 hypothetical protein [Streptomyces sp. APSN-46.1]